MWSVDLRWLPLLLALMLLLTACSSSSHAPIEDRSYPRSSTAREYRVLRGDTLYSIAFRYGLDYRRLARANGVRPPYTIYPGQRLRLIESEDAPRPASARSGTASAAKPTPSPPSAKPARPATTTVAQRPTTAQRTAPGTSTARAAAPPAAGPRGSTNAAAAWRWPGKGAVTRRFDSSIHKGIDINGARGDPVYATADGQAVYAGTGIAGYGLLLILRHDNDYLSAYAHNDELLVAEGERVRAGQTVARMGSSGTDTVQLHFELRRRGRPIDPLSQLPRR